MSDNRILQLNESDLYPTAQKYFLDYSVLDPAKENHRRILLTAEEVRISGLSGIDVRAVISRWDDACIKGGEILKGRITFHCAAFSQIPAGDIKQIYAFVLTAGECLCRDNDPITAQLFADIWGTAYVDVARVFLEKKLKADMEAEFKCESVALSTYFGPGLYGMPLTDNVALCRLLDADSIGIHTRDSGLMIPIKSSSGFYLVTCNSQNLPKQSCAECVGNSCGCAFCLSEKVNGRT